MGRGIMQERISWWSECFTRMAHLTWLSQRCSIIFWTKIKSKGSNARMAGLWSGKMRFVPGVQTVIGGKSEEETGDSICQGRLLIVQQTSWNHNQQNAKMTLPFTRGKKIWPQHFCLSYRAGLPASESIKPRPLKLRLWNRNRLPYRNIHCRLSTWWGISMWPVVFWGVAQLLLGIAFVTKIPQSPGPLMKCSTAAADKILTTGGLMQIG